MGRGVRLIVMLLCLSFALFAQNELGLGKAYLAEGKYELAEEQLQKAFKKDPNAGSFQALLKCYKQREKWSKAEKLCKRYEDISAQAVLVQIDRAQVYRLWGKANKADKLDQEVLRMLEPHNQYIIAVGQKYLQLKSYKHAEAVYKKGRKILKGDYPFAFELSEVYSATGQPTKMVDEILSVLAYGPSYKESVKNTISTQLFTDPQDKKRKLFKKRLLALSQKHSDEIIYAEMLLWMYLEEKDFQGAFLFSKAIDKRNVENGYRLMKLAKLARKDKNFRIAKRCYQYVIDEHDRSYFKQKAQMELVKVLQEKIDASPSPSEEDIEHLLNTYANTLKQVGKNAYSIDLVRGYAKALAFLKGEAPKAITLLEEAKEYPSLKSVDAAKCKIALGDIYVFTGNVWEASLLYGQVNQDFKHDLVGQEAKLKTAKAYYYTGNFEWAKTQLDVLKSRTSKLIANDAMLLSVLISDNLGMDTSTVALSFFAKADLYHYQRMNDSSLFKLNQLIYSFPDHLSLLDDAYFLQGKIYAEQRKWTEAIKAFNKVVRARDLLQDEALMQLARIHEMGLSDLARAKYYYGLILSKHTGSIFTVEARAKYRSFPVPEWDGITP